MELNLKIYREVQYVIYYMGLPEDFLSESLFALFNLRF